jgi:adenylate cyclase
MRLGTKILLLTLAITLSLAGIIVWVVSRDVSRNETERAQADIERAVSDYFGRIKSLHERAAELVEILNEEPANAGQLEQLDAGEVAAKEHFRSEIFEKFLHGKLPLKPTFDVIVNFEGQPKLAYAAGNAKLTEALSRESSWPIEPILDESNLQPRRYVWVDGGLYFTLGLPLRLEVNGPPTHAYFIGYRIDDSWAQWLLGEGKAGPEPHHIHGTETAAWFVVDGKAIAHGSSFDEKGDRAAQDNAVARIAGGGAADTRRPIAFDAGGEHFVGEAVGFELPGGRRGGLAVASSLTHALSRLRRLQATIAWVTGIVVVIAFLAFRFVSNYIARPVRQLVAGTRRVAKGEFDEPIVLKRRDELGELASSFNEMSLGLQQRDLVKSTFGKFVDPKVVEGFLKDPSMLMPGGEKRVQSVLFSDLASFTTFSEKLAPDDLVNLLNGHLGDAADIVTETRGIVDKFVGDAMVAFWGPPIVGDDEHASLACVAALRIVRSVRRLDEECARLGVPPLNVRVGVATGEVLVGIIGSANKYSYTVMGDVANLGSRLEGLNKIYGTRILALDQTAKAADRSVLTRRIDRVRVVGRAEPVEIYEVLCERGEENGSEVTLRCEAYAEAFACYERRAWADGAAAFERVAAQWPSDSAARAMAKRCEKLHELNPNADWDGVWNATNK